MRYGVERPPPSTRATVADSRGRIDWRYLRELYVEVNLVVDGEFTLGEFAEYHGIPYEFVRVWAWVEDWKEALDERRRAYKEALAAMDEWLAAQPDDSKVRPLFLRQDLGSTQLTYCINAFLARQGGGPGDQGPGPDGRDPP